MLEQPPERSLLEIEAEFAASAKVPTQRRSLALLRMIVWCIPTILFYGFLIAITFVSPSVIRGTHIAVEITIFLLLIIVSTLFVGCYDELLTSKPWHSSRKNRHNKTLNHAIRFTLWQVLMIPANSIILLGVSSIYFHIAYYK